MLFIVPEPAGKTAEDSAPGGGIKVELDLDDAPFLADEEPEPEPRPEEPAPETLPPPAEDAAPKKSRLAGLLADKKRLAFIGGAAVGLIIAAVAVNVFLFGGEPEKPKPRPVYEVVPGSPPPPDAVKPPYAHLVSWEPFIVELRGEDGGLRFLSCKVAIPVADDAQYAEVTAKKVVLRDAVYYFLRNRPPELLSTPEKNAALRADIAGVLNGHLNADIKDVYLEEYLVTDPNRP